MVQPLAYVFEGVDRTFPATLILPTNEDKGKIERP
jgi:hypothetical protein